jgi:hypothetical protein
MNDDDEVDPQIVLIRYRGRLIDEDGFEYPDWKD